MPNEEEVVETDATEDTATDTTGTEQETPEGESKLDVMTDEQLRAEVTRLRRENAGKRTAARDANEAATAAAQQRDSILQTVATALGIKQEGETVTIESLQAQLTEATGKASTVETVNADLQRENAVLRHAPALNANGDRLLDSRSFLNTLSTVDPLDAKAVQAAITAALTEDSGFALVKVPGSSGSTDHTGGDSTDRAKSMREAASKRLGFTL